MNGNRGRKSGYVNLERIVTHARNLFNSLEELSGLEFAPP